VGFPGRLPAKYRTYEHFAIGNFDLGDRQFPQSKAIQPFHSQRGKYVSRKLKDSEHAVAGIGLKYSQRPRLPEDVRTAEDSAVQRALSQGERHKLSCTMLAGSKPVDEKWKPIDTRPGIPPINRIYGYFQP
jgi:hypothetical protein